MDVHLYILVADNGACGAAVNYEPAQYDVVLATVLAHLDVEHFHMFGELMP